MSVTRVDPLTYSRFHTELVAVYVNQGHALSIARTMATEDMSDTFVCDPFMSIIEDQRDAEEERDGFTR